VTGRRRLRSPGGLAAAGGSFARVLRTEALRTRRLPHTAAPAPAGPRRNVPVPRPRKLARPSPPRQVHRSPCEGHSRRAGMPRIVRDGPSSLNGAPHRAARDAIDPGASAAPAGLTTRARPEAWPESARHTSALSMSD